MQEYAARASSIGLAEIGFSDHFPMLHVEDRSLSMGMEELPEYVQEVEGLRPGFPGLEIKLGIEVDFIPETAERLPDLLKAQPYDYIMGSVHYIDGWGFDHPRNIEGYAGRDLMALWERYFDLLGDAAESGLFDVLAHPDLIKKFGFRPDADVRHLYEACLDRVAAAGSVIEVNSGGLRKPVGEIYPGFNFLLLCRERDIPLTLGSDAHCPEEVGEGFEEVLSLLRKVGYEELTIFNRRKRSLLRLPEVFA
jgi:histidinol-phosphatase (PHP family)